MKLLVTGGSGFIGTNFIKTALKAGFQICNIDNLSLFYSDLNPLSKNYSFENINILDKDKVSKILIDFRPKRLINFAAETHVDKSIKQSEIFLKTNIFGTYSLLEAVLNYKKSKSFDKDFIFHQISTDEVYGSLAIDIKNNLFNENSNYKPNSPYSASKASSDHLITAWANTYDIFYNITYCSNNYGPFQHPSKFIPVIIINNILKNQIPLYGDGQQIRDWIYVQDHVDALIKIINSNVRNEKYVIGADNEIKNIDVVKIVCKNFNKLDKKKFDHNLLIKFVEDRKGHDKRYGLDTTKIKKDLLWNPKIDFLVGLKKTITWFKENKKWWNQYYK